jgi:hypothetical protein
VRIKLECLSLANLPCPNTLILPYDYGTSGQFGKVNFMSVITPNGINVSVVMLNVVPPRLLHARFHFYSCMERHKTV